ncbi:MAG: hypothetical protein ABJA67_18310 [Chthonomonadales bacterium]
MNDLKSKIFETFTANSIAGRSLRTTLAIFAIVVGSYIAGAKILGPLLANAAGIRPGAVYTFSGGSDHSHEPEKEPKAPPPEISSKSDPGMEIAAVMPPAKKHSSKKKPQTKPVEKKPVKEEKQMDLDPPPPSTPDPVDPTEPKPPTDPDKGPDKEDRGGYY